MRPRSKYRDEFKAKKQKKAAFKAALGLAALALAIIGIIYTLFFAGLFDLRTINIAGAETIPQSEIQSEVRNFLDSRAVVFKRRVNPALFTSEALQFELAIRFPKIESIKVVKKMPHTLDITLQERKPAGIWCMALQKKCFYFDKSGVAYEETNPTRGFLITNVTDNRSRELVMGSFVEDDTWLKNIVEAKELLHKAGVGAAEFRIPSNSFDEFEVETAEGWEIKFAISGNVPSQISALSTFLKEKIPSNKRSTLQYVDLRIRDRIYYK